MTTLAEGDVVAVRVLYAELAEAMRGVVDRVVALIGVVFLAVGLARISDLRGLREKAGHVAAVWGALFGDRSADDVGIDVGDTAEHRRTPPLRPRLVQAGWFVVAVAGAAYLWAVIFGDEVALDFMRVESTALLPGA